MASAGQITTFNGRRCTKVPRSGGANQQSSTTSSSSTSSTSTTSTSQAQSTTSSSSSSSSTPTSTTTSTTTSITSTSTTVQQQQQTLITTPTLQPAPSPPPPPNNPAPAAAAPAPPPPAGGAAQAGPAAQAPAPAQQAPQAAPAPANPPAAPSSQAPAPAPSSSAAPSSSQASDVGAAQAAPTSQDSSSASQPANSAPAVTPQQSAFSALPDLLPSSATTLVSPVASASGSSPTDSLSSLISSGSALTTPLQPLAASATTPGATLPSNTSAVAGKLPASLVPAGNDGSATGDHDPTNHDPTADTKSSGPSSKMVAVTAGSISGALGLLMIGALIFFCMKRRARRRGMIEVHSPTFAEKRAGGRSSFGGGSAVSRFVSNRWASLAVLKKPFHRRSASRVGLTEDADVYPPMRAVGAQQYRNRRSQSEPRQSWRTPPSKPILTNEANVGRPRSIDSPGQINNYQIPWDPNTDSNTPVQKTLRVVNSEIENSPNLGGVLSSVDDSFYGLQVPAKAAAPSHRRSISLQPQSEDPFRDSPDQNGNPNGFDWLRDDSGAIGRAISQGPAASNAASSYYGTRYSSRRTSSRGSNDRTGFERASVDLANAIAISRQSSISYTKNPFSEDQTRAQEPHREYASNRTSRSSVSSVTSSILSELAGGGYVSGSDNSATLKGSPVTTPSRNVSDASRASYDPFKYEPTPYKPLAAATGLRRSDSRASSISGRSAPPSTVFDEKTAAAFATFGEPGPTRPGTEAYPAFTMLNGPNAGDGVPDSGFNIPATRRTTRVSNDPFDLDCPEVLGYRSGLGRSDSNAGKRGTVGYGRRRSSIQAWRDLGTVEERSLKSDVNRRR